MLQKIKAAMHEGRRGAECNDERAAALLCSGFLRDGAQAKTAAAMDKEAEACKAGLCDECTSM